MRNAKNLLTVFLSSIFLIYLSGCTTIDPITVKTEAVEKIPLNLTDPSVLRLKKITWFVITPENIDDVFAEMKKQNLDLVLFGLSDEKYEDLSGNVQEIRKYLLQQKQIIAAYKQYYEGVK